MRIFFNGNTVRVIDWLHEASYIRPDDFLKTAAIFLFDVILRDIHLIFKVNLRHFSPLHGHPISPEVYFCPPEMPRMLFWWPEMVINGFLAPRNPKKVVIIRWI